MALAPARQRRRPPPARRATRRGWRWRGRPPTSRSSRRCCRRCARGAGARFSKHGYWRQRALLPFLVQLTAHSSSAPQPRPRPRTSHPAPDLHLLPRYPQAQYGGALPDPARNFTVFAPTDSAFFGLLTTFSERPCCWPAALPCCLLCSWRPPLRGPVAPSGLLHRSPPLDSLPRRPGRHQSPGPGRQADGRAAVPRRARRPGPRPAGAA